MDLLAQALNQLAPKHVGIEEFSESSDFCGKNLYPAQATLLKLIFLEELTGPEEDILTGWINGGRNGTEIGISPNVRERVEWCREAGYPHFREVALVGGRRSSKGFCTGLAMGKLMWETLQKGDPGSYYGIAPEKEIYFSCIAGSQEQSQGRQYADFSSTVETCKAFDPFIVKSLETEIRVATDADLRRIAQEKSRGNRIQKDIARLRGNAMAANSGTIRGLAMMAYAQPLDAKVLQPHGWGTIGDLVPGSEVIGSDGEPQTVTKIWPRGEQRAFRVTFSDGSSTVCSKDHLWTLQQAGRGFKTKPLIDFEGDLNKSGCTVEHAKWRLPRQPLIDIASDVWPLHPYLVGAMLGDGCMTTRAAQFTNADDSVIEALRDVLPLDHSIVSRAPIQWSITSSTRKNLVIRGLKDLGLWGIKGPKKSIPESYLRLSPEGRLALLQGLLDTDGSVNGTSVRFGSSSETLAIGVVELARSLGGYATLHRSVRTKSSVLRGRKIIPQGEFYEVCISGLRSSTLFRSRLKKDYASNYARYAERHRRLVSVEEIGTAEMRCITVSNSDGLYITDDFIITHNCIDEIAHMLPGESKSSPNKIYEAANPSLGQFGVDGMAFLNSSPYTKIGLFYEKYVEGMIEFDPDRPVDEPAPLLEDGLDLQDRNGEPRLLVFQFPSWALYEGYQKSKHRKKLKAVLMGSPDWDLDELDEDGEPLWTEKDKQLSRTARAEEQTNPEGFKVEYRGKFAEVTDAYMEPRRIDEMFAGLPHEWVYDHTGDHPEIPKLVVLPFSTNAGKDATNLFRYKFHLDPSSTTAGFGFAIAHAETIDDWKGQAEEHVVFDLIKRWEPKRFPGKVIRWPTILEEVIKYAEFFFPFEITMDQHESMQPVQELSEKLNERGIPCRVYIKPATAELNWHRWEVCKTSIYAKLVHAPSDTEDARWCSQELKYLQIQGGTSKFPRVDRQEIGPVQTKDMADCYDDQTEVLTRKGWRLFRDVAEDDEVATRSDRGRLEWQVPTAHIERQYEGWLSLHETDRLNFCVTPTHNMLLENKAGSTRLVHMEEITSKVVKIPKTCSVEKGLSRDYDWAALLGFWLADGRKISDYGGKKSVRLTQTKAADVKWFDELLDRLGLEYVRNVQANGETAWSIKSYELQEEVRSMQEGDELRLPKSWTYWPIGPRLALFEGLLRGDGRFSVDRNRYVAFCNTSRNLVDEIQALLLTVGMAGRVRLVRAAGTTTNLGVSTKDLWDINIDVKSHARMRQENVRSVWYDGTVYCLTVPNHTLFVRRRGTAMWCGNCVAECVNTLIGNQISNRTRERLSQSAVFPGAEGGYGIGFSGTTLRPGGAPPNLENYEFDRLRKAQQAYDSPTRGALGKGRASRRSNRARW